MLDGLNDSNINTGQAFRQKTCPVLGVSLLGVFVRLVQRTPTGTGPKFAGVKSFDCEVTLNFHDLCKVKTGGLNPGSVGDVRRSQG